MVDIQDTVEVIQQAGVVPFIVFIVVTLLVLIAFKRVYPALAIGVAGAIIAFLINTPTPVG